MSWRDTLRRVAFGNRDLVGASFRGVPFFVDSADRATGRRVVTHEFPYRDAPYHEDLGKKGRAYRVEGYVIGDDYLAQRDALLDKLEAAGPGELIHPYYGRLIVVCTSASHREGTSDGGVCTFSLEFLDAPAQAVEPTIVDDAAAQLASSADAASAASSAEFVAKYDTQSLPAFALASAERALIVATEAFESLIAPVVTVTQELAELTAKVEVITARASSLVRQPAELFASFRDAITGLVNAIRSAPRDVGAALLGTYSSNMETAIIPTTATRVREFENQAALVAALRRILVIEAARLAAVATYASIEDAVVARAEVVVLLDEQAGAADDTAYPALVDLRSKLLTALPGGRAFARVITTNVRDPIPSLLLAYRMFGSVSNEADLVARNRVSHPGFISGEVKALSDE